MHAFLLAPRSEDISPTIPPTVTPGANSNINALSSPGKWEEEGKSGASHTRFRTEEGSAFLSGVHWGWGVWISKAPWVP